MTLARRIIPCLDVVGGRVVKGVEFAGLRDMGDPTPRRSLANALRAVDEAPVRSQEGEGGALDIRPSLKDRLSALEPFEPLPVAEAAPKP